MPRINQLQMQIHRAFIPNFTIKGWLHAKHLARHYSRERQLRSANLPLAIDKYLDPRLLLMETIWPVPEKGQSAEAGKESSSFSSLPALAVSLPKNLFRSGRRCGDGCRGKESGAGWELGWERRDEPLFALCARAAGRTQRSSAASGGACSPSLLTAALLKGKPVC